MLSNLRRHLQVCQKNLKKRSQVGISSPIPVGLSREEYALPPRPISAEPMADPVIRMDQKVEVPTGTDSSASDRQSVESSVNGNCKPRLLGEDDSGKGSSIVSTSPKENCTSGKDLKARIATEKSSSSENQDDDYEEYEKEPEAITVQA